MTAKLYHGAAWYPELWNEDVLEEDIQMMKDTGINLVRMGEFVWSVLEPEEGHIDITPFARFIDRLHQHGIDTIMCTPTPTPPIWMTHQHPERCFVDQHGTVMGHGARQHICTNHPYFRERAAILAEHLARELGQLSGLVGWQLDNEFKAHVAECMCSTCLGLWHEWLEARYGTIEQLNEAWGTNIWNQRYQRFDQVPQPGPAPFLHSSSLWTMYRLFSMEKIAEFADEQAAILRRHSAAPITHNSSVAFHVDNERLYQNLDFASYDTYASQENVHAYLLNCDLWRNFKPGRSFWIMETSSSFAGSLKSYARPHPNGYLKAEAVAAYALGAEAFCYWLWRQQRSGSEQTHSAVLSAWGNYGVGYVNVLKVESARRELEPLLLHSRPLQAEVAIAYSDRTKAYLATEPHRGLNYRGLLGDYYKRVLNMGIHRDLLPEGAELSGYKLLLTPFVHYISPEYLAKARQFVAEGGTWIVGPLSGGRTQEHTIHTDAALGKELEELAGIQTKYTYPMEHSGAIGHAFGVSAELSLWSAVFEPLPGESVSIGEIKGGLTPGLSFITERSYGRGSIVMLGSLPTGDDGDLLLRKLIDHYAEQSKVRLRTDVTPGTIVCPRQGEDDELWVVVNMDGHGGSVTLPHLGEDALSGQQLPPGPLKLGAYEYRTVRFPA